MMSPVHVPRNCCQAMRPPPLSIPAPHLCPNFRSSPVPSFPPFPSLGLSIQQVGNPGLEFCRGEGTAVGWCKAPRLG